MEAGSLYRLVSLDGPATRDDDETSELVSCLGDVLSELESRVLSELQESRWKEPRVTGTASSAQRGSFHGLVRTAAL